MILSCSYQFHAAKSSDYLTYYSLHSVGETSIKIVLCKQQTVQIKIYICVFHPRISYSPFHFSQLVVLRKFNHKRQFPLRKSLRSHKEYKLYLIHIKYFKIFNMTQNLQKEPILVTIMQQNETWIVIMDSQLGYCIFLAQLFTVSKLLCLLVMTILILSCYFNNQ